MKSHPTLISLFAGAGGLDIGLEQAGFTTLAVNELEYHACETLRQNKALSFLQESQFNAWFDQQMQQRCYANLETSEKDAFRKRLSAIVGKRPFLKKAQIIEGSIRDVTSQQLLDVTGMEAGSFTLVAGGPPCQPFSRAGKRETVETDDGKLFLEFVRVVRDLRPRWFLFENVKGLAQSRTVVPYISCSECKKTSLIGFEGRKSALEGNYEATSCTHCGSTKVSIDLKDVPGGSLDIILNEFESIGYKCKYKILNSADFGVPQARERLFIVGSRDGEAFTWPRPTHAATTEFAKNSTAGNQLTLLDDQPLLKPRVNVSDVLWKNGHPEFGPLDYNTAVLWVKNVVRPHAEAVTWSLHRPSPTVGAHQAAKLAIAPEGVPEEQLARQQWHTKGRRQGDLPPVKVKHAMLSDEDLLRLQTFPPDWYLYGTRMQRAFQIGNAVPPVLGAVMGKAILAACGYDNVSLDEHLKKAAA